METIFHTPREQGASEWQLFEAVRKDRLSVFASTRKEVVSKRAQPRDYRALELRYQH